MSVKLAKAGTVNENTLASVYSDFVQKNMSINENLMHVECDLGLSLFKFDLFGIVEKFPDRFINVGIQEANGVGFACGASMAGYVPFVHSFGPFMSRRAADQVFISGAYSKSNVKVIGSDPGVVAAYNGGTHMPFEDLAIMRSIPEVKIIEVTDNIAAKALFPKIADDYGMYYIRMARGVVSPIYEDGTDFEIGKGNVLTQGDDVTIIASGIMVEEGLKAVELLKAEGVAARLVDMFSIRPLDKDLVEKCAKETGAIVTAENHSINGGLGDAVTQVVMERCLVPTERIAVREKFGQVGDVPFLKEQYQLTAQDIANAAKKAILKK